MMNLTREQAIAEHRKMWNWIADETLKRKEIVDKQDYFVRLNIPLMELPIYYCWCCEYANHPYRIGLCVECPIDWGCPLSTGCQENPNSPYAKWLNCSDYDYELAAKYAREIANLPERGA